MSQELLRRLDGYTHLLEQGDWKSAAAAMHSDGIPYKSLTYVMDKIGFYPSPEFLQYYLTLRHAKNNKEVLDNFFSFN